MPVDRGPMFGILGSVLAVGAASGPVVGARRTELFGWQTILLANLLVVAVALVVSLRSNSTDMGGSGSASNSDPEPSKEPMWNPFGLYSLLWHSVSVWASLHPQLHGSRAGIGTGATSRVGRRRILDESHCRQCPCELGHHRVRGHGHALVERPLRARPIARMGLAMLVATRLRSQSA